MSQDERRKKNAIRLNTGLWFGHPIAVDTDEPETGNCGRSRHCVGWGGGQSGAVCERGGMGDEGTAQ